jgi:RNA polymerase sigma-70 factor (ECF subfamily)
VAATVLPHRPTPASVAPPLPARGVPVDDARLQTFIAAEYRQVVATVELVCGSLATAEDAVQEALARAWERGESIDRLGAWITTVALNLARSQMRRWRAERRARDRIGPPAMAPDAPGASAEAHAVREALRALPRRQREVTVLRYYAGLNVDEIAAALEISSGNVKAMLFRARQALAAGLSEETDDAHT